MNVDAAALVLVTLGSAWLFAILQHRETLSILLKTRAQRTPAQQKQVGRGLHKEILLEFFIFVPTSAALVILIGIPLAYSIPGVKPFINDQQFRIAIYALLGIVSYKFPFSVLKQVVVRIVFDFIRQVLKHVTETSEAQESPDEQHKLPR